MKKCLAVLGLLGLLHLAPIQAQDSDWVQAMKKINKRVPDPFRIDESLTKTVGLRKIESKHLTLYTDVLPHPRVDNLPALFDQCVPQWCEYFEINPRKASSWRMRAYLISDRAAGDKFRRAGLIPDALPDFQAGYQQMHDIWFFLQPGDYYTRHLLVHEGTHAFMQWFLDGYGAPWYSEGMAELFGANQLVDGKLKIRYRLQDRSEAEYWGRVKRIRDERETTFAMSLDDVLNIEPNAFRKVRFYGWSWAACDFLGRHDASREEFRRLFKRADLTNSAFNQKLKNNLASSWSTLERDWLLFINEIDYGFEVERGQILPAKVISTNVAKKQARLQIRSDHSWQSTKFRVKAGDRFLISASGRFKVGESQTTEGLEDWPCEANGITIRYHRGLPLGILTAACLDVEAKAPSQQIAELKQPFAIGTKKIFTAKHDGNICLRINESPAHLEDNVGTLEVLIEKLK